MKDEPQWFAVWVATGQEAALTEKFRRILREAARPTNESQSTDWPSVASSGNAGDGRMREAARPTAGIEEAFFPVMALWQRRQGEWALKEQTVFPGYVFIRCAMSSAVYHAVRELPGVLGWLGRDSLWPTAVPQQEMDVVLALYQGVDPGEVLTDLRADRRQRRGYGRLTLQGKTYRIPYNIYAEDETEGGRQAENKQAEEPAGDASPQEG